MVQHEGQLIPPQQPLAPSLPDQPLALTHLCWSAMFGLSYDHLLPHCPHLCYLTIGAPKRGQDQIEKVLEQCQSWCPELKHLGVGLNAYHPTADLHRYQDASGTYQPSPLQSGLREICIDYWELSALSAAACIFKARRSLTVLKILNGVDDPAQFWEACMRWMDTASTRLPLESLQFSLNGQDIAPAPSLPAFLGLCPSLKSLTLKGVSCSDYSLAWALARTPELEYISLTDIDRINDATENRYSSHQGEPDALEPIRFTRLQTLDIENSSIATDALLGPMQAMDTLTYWKLKRCEDASASTLANFVGQSPQLQSAFLFRVQNLDDAAVLQMTRIPSLTRVSFLYCPHVSRVGVKALQVIGKKVIYKPYV